MTARRWSFYKLDDGTFTGDHVSSSDDDFAPTIPEGCGAYEGAADWKRECIDLTTGERISYRPPAPDAEHEWNEARKRWQLKPEAQASNAQRADALAQIITLEASQARALRELVLNPDDSEARARVAAINSQIANLRQPLRV